MRHRFVILLACTVMAGSPSVTAAAAPKFKPNVDVPVEKRVAGKYDVVVAKAKYKDFYSRIDLAALAVDGEGYLFLDIGRKFFTVHVTVDTMSLYKVQTRRGRRSKKGMRAVFRNKPEDMTISRRSGTLRIYRHHDLIFSADNSGGPVHLRAYAKRPFQMRLQKVAAYSLRDGFDRETFDGGQAWTTVSGSWRLMTLGAAKVSPNPFACVGEGAPAKDAGELTSAVAVAGHPFLGNLRFSAAVRLMDASSTGVVFGYQDDRSYFKAVVSRKGGRYYFVLARVDGGGTTVLKEQAIEPVRENWYRITVDLKEGESITAGIDNLKLELDGDPIACFGKVGLTVTGGKAMFDDIRLASPAGAEPTLIPLNVKSRAYSQKIRYAKDKRDDHLDRWAHDADAWIPSTVDYRGVRYAGYRFHLPLMSDFKVTLTDATKKRLLYLTAVDTGKNLGVILKGGKVIERRQGSIFAGKRPITGFPTDAPLVIGYYAEAPAGAEVVDPQALRPDPKSLGGYPAMRRLGYLVGSDGLNDSQARRVTEYLKDKAFELPSISARNVRQDFFEESPVDWLQVSGDWTVAARWQCANQWGFYSGTGKDAAIQISKFRFTGDQVHEFYFGMVDLFGRKYKKYRYARHDVNISFMTDGRDLFSGYTFIFSGYDNRASYLLRGRHVVAENKEIKFNRFVDIDDLHLFWRKIRCERIGNRIRVLIDRQVIFDFTDRRVRNRPTGGHVALWTYRNGVVFARMNSSAHGMDGGRGVLRFPMGDTVSKSDNSPWRSLAPSRVVMKAGTGKRFRVVNRFSGGEFAVVWQPDDPVNLRQTPILTVDLNIPKGTKVNLHLTVSGRTFMLPLTAPVEETYRILGEPPVSGWKPYVNPPITKPRASGKPRVRLKKVLRVNLLREVRRCFEDLYTPMLTHIYIGNTSHKKYLMAGLSGNAADAWYEVGDIKFKK